MAQVTGICTIYSDGALQRSKKGAKLDVGGMKRESITGHSVYGYSESVEPSKLEATLAHMADTDVVDISGWVNKTIRFETDTGQVYTVQGAWVTEPCSLADGGDLTLKMEGPPAEKE